MRWSLVLAVLALTALTYSEAGNYAMSIADARKLLERHFLNEAGKKNIDLVFVLQSSGSVGRSNFGAYKLAIKDLLRHFSISRSFTRVALITFGKDPVLQFNFNHASNKDCVLKAINAVQFKTGLANLGGGMTAAFNLIKDGNTGARSDSRQLVFVISDGLIYNKETAASTIDAITAEQRRSVYLLGIGLQSRFESFKVVKHSWYYKYFINIAKSNDLRPLIRQVKGVKRVDQCNARNGAVVYDGCARRCKCYNKRITRCFRVRKEFTAMSSTEKTRYLQAYIKLTTKQPYKARYDNFIKLYQHRFNSDIHKKSQFLPWHRWFILEMENLLREVDCRVTVPYWQWSIQSHKPWSSSGGVWGSGSQSFGENGQGSQGCVSQGLFRQQSWKTKSGKCLSRKFNGATPDQVAIATLLKRTNFNEFEFALRAVLHNGVHCQFGGTMCSKSAAEAPEFFLHNGFIDKTWNDWQKKSYTNLNAYFPSVSGRMTDTPYQRKDLINLRAQPGCVQVLYDPAKKVSMNNIQDVVHYLNGLSEQKLKNIPRVRTASVSYAARSLFTLSASENQERTRLEKLLQGKIDYSKTQQLTSSNKIEDILGFKVPVH